MNADSLKSEIQQVLDQDLTLRKEYNELKRSLSDYRNQLIMRDEDCKRLQVTIDVLNTKLLVMERDNTAYKTELTSFKELRDNIHEQLEAKQQEIDNRLEEISELKQELAGITNSYESKIESLKENAERNLEELKALQHKQVEELKSTAYYRENGIRDEFENRISELSANWFEREQGLIASRDSSLEYQREQYENMLASLKLEMNNNLRESSAILEKETQHLIAQHQEEITELERIWQERLSDNQARYESELTLLREENSNLVKNSELQIQTKLAEVVAAYEEKLSNTLIHSNSQNTKLNEEIQVLQEDIRNITQRFELSEQTSLERLGEIGHLSQELGRLQNELVEEVGRYAELKSDFEIFKQGASLSDSEKVVELNYQVDRLNQEIANMSHVFEGSTNQLAETEISLESKIKEIASLQERIAELEKNKESGSLELETFKSEFLITVEGEIHQRHLDYQKLLSENENLIREIELSQNRQEGLEGELGLLKDEMEQMRLQAISKSEDFRETITAKQSEIEELQGQLSRMISEHQELRLENQVLQDKLQQHSTILQSENQNLLSQVSEFKLHVQLLQEKMQALNHENQELLNRVSSLAGSEQNELIDSLRIQIEALSEQKMALLDEKEQMADQLLKLNEVIGSISQQVDNESIDVSGLNNHRKNVILAGLQNRNEDVSEMKEQINNLVREIDKCIALLGA